MLTYFLAWFPLLILAILNGVVREVAYKKKMGDKAAHQLSTFTLILLFALYIYVVLLRFPPATAAEALWIGSLWVLLTLCFEFGFGRYRGNSWKALLAEYNVLRGKVWVLIPLWVMVAPFLFYRLIGKG